MSLLDAMVKECPSALGRLHALWTLDLLGVLDSAAILSGSGRSRAEGSRASHSPGRNPARRASRRLLAKLLALADDPDPMVRFQLAFSLGEANADPRRSRPWPRSPSRMRAASGLDRGLELGRRAFARLFGCAWPATGFLHGPCRPGWLDRARVPGGLGARRRPSRESARTASDRQQSGTGPVMRAVLALARGGSERADRFASCAKARHPT